MPRPRKDTPKPDAAAQIERRRAVTRERQARHRARVAATIDRLTAALARIRDAATVEQAREVARQAMESDDAP